MDKEKYYTNPAPTPQVPPATNGGQVEPKPIPYSPPVGPKSTTTGPGLGGTNYGNCGTQGKR